jgi:hypothetical protein
MALFYAHRPPPWCAQSEPVDSASRGDPVAAPAPTLDEQLHAIDLCVVRALRDIRMARISMDHSPSGANISRVERAEQTLDDLLDQRLTIRPARRRATR